MIARLVECSDYDEIYGILEVEGISTEEVQDKIYEIKNRFYDEGFDGWSIEDVFEEFPDDWKWGFTNGDNVIEI